MLYIDNIGGCMDNNIMSLREYINNREQVTSIKVQTFCRLMKMVSMAIEKEERKLIRINLDEIKINVLNGKIILPDNLFSTEELDKTIVGFNTGISVMADRKSTDANKSVSFALMMLGWYCNNDSSSINSDLDVLENFDLYMSKVPEWLHDFFINIFRRMNYDESFSDYYDKKFTNKIKNDIKEAFSSYDLSEEQLSRITKIIAGRTNRKIKEGVDDEI